MKKLLKKIKLTGKIKLVTGLHIGGSKADAQIGGIDVNIIKKPNGDPYIPGSSLKGKMRSLLEKENGKEKICECSQESCPICLLFGNAKESGQGRLIFRDSNMIEESKEYLKEKLDGDLTEAKTENVINRVTGKAEHPRQIERIPAGALFDYEVIINIFEDDNEQFIINSLKKAMNLLQDDYLGGSGTRGYGKIKFEEVNAQEKNIKDY